MPTNITLHCTIFSAPIIDNFTHPFYSFLQLVFPDWKRTTWPDMQPLLTKYLPSIRKRGISIKLPIYQHYVVGISFFRLICSYISSKLLGNFQAMYNTVCYLRTYDYWYHSFQSVRLLIVYIVTTSVKSTYLYFNVYNSVKGKESKKSWY